MSGKSFFVDLSLCTACRGCQVACKQWKNLPAEKTRNVGSHQNPQDLSFQTIRLVRFNEARDANNKLQWYFFPEQCRHCLEPPCKYIGNMYCEDGIEQDATTGAVVMNGRTAGIGDNVTSEELCPYNVPRMDEESGQWFKCDMCLDRVEAGRLPACVQSCPTGTMNFGDRADMLALAEKRLAEVKKTNPDAYLADPESVRVIYLCTAAPESYNGNLLASLDGSKLMKQTLAKAEINRRDMLAGRFGSKTKA
ncbi:4Fe-4S dicluster domain-containing protein [Pseudodesulfovibrio sediminis]|uniref:Formate dehydrogenase subunit beta n=1 Tax=Pseudodesulfovibrio sediminis TaxID=2810563 RepID=A0ABM7PA16_9BACT|nr:4Fe-4S dicluster domain-containing protein [Pseudodesulfovibrio sediminis]BCS89913.1 formate dehydrogenase subunit beta [Pseudodesulfovibrio sediminis]